MQIFQLAKVAVVAVAMASAAAEARDLTVTLEKTVETQYSEFVDHNGNGWYDENQSKDHATTVVTGEGILAALNSTKSTIDTAVIGRDIRGYHRVGLYNRDGRIYLRKKFDAQLDVEGEVYSLSGDYQGEMMIESGTWQGFLSGQKMVLRPTAEASQNLIQLLQEKTKAAFEALAANSQESGLEVKNLRIDSIEVLQGGLVHVQGRKMWSQGAKVRVKASFQVPDPLL